MPFGLSGVWFACCFVIYSFIGVEIVAITSGEATDPAVTIPARDAAHGVEPVGDLHRDHDAAAGDDAVAGAGCRRESVRAVLATLGIPGAAGVMNFVVLSAALSSANANIYVIARTLFSLARGGYVPAASAGSLGGAHR